MVDSRPDYLVRVVKEVNGRERWIDVGVAYQNEKGTVIIYLTALPFSDRMLLIPVKDEA